MVTVEVGGMEEAEVMGVAEDLDLGAEDIMEEPEV